MNHSYVLGIVRDVLATTWRIGRVVATELVDSTGLRVDIDLQGPDGTVPRREVWGHAGFTSRPPVDAEVLAWMRGDDALVIATKSRTHEVVIKDGEVAMHNLPSDSSKQTVLRIDPDSGDVNLELAAGAKMTATRPGGSPSAVVTEADFNTWKTNEYDGHQHGGVIVAVAGGSGSPATGTTGSTAGAPTAASINGSPALEAD